jgi:hypothetical protein
VSAKPSAVEAGLCGGWLEGRYSILDDVVYGPAKVAEKGTAIKVLVNSRRLHPPHINPCKVLFLHSSVF